jgi:hypothetical protein
MTIAALITFIIWAVVLGLVVLLALWVIGELGIPDPFARIARVLIVVIACLILLFQALPMAGIS